MGFLTGGVLACALALAGCIPYIPASRAAAIRGPDGNEQEMIIHESTAAGLFVEDPQGRRLWLRHAQVTEIRHPGKVHLLVGSLLLGLGATTTTLAVLHPPQGAHTSGAALVLLPALAGLYGLAMTIDGGFAYFPSRSHAAAFHQR